MATILKNFFKMAVSAQLMVAGTPCTAKRLKTKESWEFVAVITSRDGSLTAEHGGTEYVVSAHALIPKGCGYIPAVGDRIDGEGCLYMVINTISSPDDAAFSCDLVSITV